MAPGTSSPATLFTLPYYTSRSCQIIEPQLNRGSIRSPARRSFVWNYFKKSRLFNVIARVLPKQSPGTTQPAPPRIPPSHTKHHHLFKTTPWTSSNQNGFVPRIFLNPRVIIFLIFHPNAWCHCEGVLTRSNLPAAPNQPFPRSRLLRPNVITFLKH